MHALCAYPEIGEEGKLFDRFCLYLPVPLESFKEGFAVGRNRPR